MPEARPLQTGDPERLGAYRLIGRVGEGGQGTVYLGESPDGERVAIKLLHSRLSGDPKARSRFAAELDHAKRVMPFCTARVLDADAEGDFPYIVSEFIDGPSLDEVLRRDGPRTATTLDRLAIGTVTALTAIHETGIVHRDLKPGNVILASDGPRVIDFGIARALDTTGTLTNASVGTPAYMAPEQFSGSQIGPPADVFAWGCTMAFAASGRPPHGDDSIPAIMNRVFHKPPDLGDLSGPLRDIVAQCLAKDPAQRPSARQILLRLLGSADEPGGAKEQTPSAAPPQHLLTQGVAAAAPAAAAGAAGAFPTQPPGYPPPPATQPSPYAPQGPSLYAAQHQPPYAPQGPSPYAAQGQAPYAPHSPQQGSTPPPFPAPGPYGLQSPYTAPSQAPPPRQGPNTGLIIGLAGGGLAVIIALVVAVIAVTNSGSPKVTNSPAASTSPATATPAGSGHRILAADSAGGWQRDLGGEQTLRSTINQQRSTLNSTARGQLSGVTTAFYKDPNGGTSSTGNPAGVIFIGGTGPLGDPDNFVSGFRRSATSNTSTTVTEVSAGSGGGKGVCAELRSAGQTISFCAWATEDSFGEIVPTVPGRSTTEMAQLMRTMRPDLEQPR
jgi:serine/threonine protein kinase